MRIMSVLVGLAALVGGCYQPDQQSTMPQQQGGPPNGAYNDPYYQHYEQQSQVPQQGPPGYPQAAQGYGPPQQPQPYDDQGQDQGQGPGPDQGPPPPEGYAQQGEDPANTADVNDDQINQTLAPYGQWADQDGQRVWYPSDTAVGADFTPYDSCGSWAYTSYGWTFNCSYGWGWLPFHYGRWNNFGGRWGWSPGYHWGAAWVSWRGGNGYIGWRPLGSGVSDAHWRFNREGDFGHGSIGAHRIDGRVGLRSTSAIGHPGFSGPRVSTGAVMGGRGVSTGGAVRGGAIGGGPSGRVGGTYGGQGSSGTLYRSSSYRAPAAQYRGGSTSYHSSAQPSFHSSYHSTNSGGSHFSGGSHYGGGGHYGGGSSHSSGGGGHHR